MKFILLILTSCNTASTFVAPASRSRSVAPVTEGNIVLDDNGNEAFVITLPPSDSDSSEVSIVIVDIDSVPDSDRIFSTVVIDVKLYDIYNNQIPLKGNAELCFEVKNSNEKVRSH
jgi:hypothetical protein